MFEKQKISVYTTITNPEIRGDAWREAIANYIDFADEVIVVDGGSTDGSVEEILKMNNPKLFLYENKWDWNRGMKMFPDAFNYGLERTTGDWAIRLDIDQLFHKRDFKLVRKVLFQSQDSPMVGFAQFNILTATKGLHKCNRIIAINKKGFGDKVKHGENQIEGNDWAYPVVVKGKRESGLYYGESNFNFTTSVPFYNYDHFFKTKEQVEYSWVPYNECMKEISSAYRKLETTEEKMGKFISMLQNRYDLKNITFEENAHPIHIREKVKNLKPEQLGYNLWGYAK